MMSYEYLLSSIDNIHGIGNKTAKLFRKKNINTILILYGRCLEILLIEVIW